MSTTHRETADELEAAIRNAHRSAIALGAAMAALELPVSPQSARRLQATENAWRAIEDEFGLLTGAEVATLLGSKARGGGTYAGDKRHAGQLLGIKRRNAYLYPGFQFESRNHTILPVVPQLIAIARKYSTSMEGLTQWLCAETGQLSDQRPVDLLSQPVRVLEAARNDFGVEW